ncbi:MAG: MtrB/PioB family decaheme-associated outer membrane protein [bacterium]|nr:MtrB/PioB family decaheme-associated outer membrane protein [bacterium]
MMKIKNIIAPAIAFICLLSLYSPAAAAGGFDGSVTIGAGATDLDEKSHKKGEYDGVKDDASRFIGDVNLSLENDGDYIDLKAEDIGLDDRSFSIKLGNYGSYQLHMEYSELTHLLGEGITPFIGAGGDVLALPPGFSQHTTTSQMVVDPQWTTQSIDLETQRKKASIAYSREIGSNYSFKLGYSREIKEGTQSIGGMLGASGQFTSASILPEPIDYRTNDITAGITYNGEKGMVSIAYLLSTFENKNEALLWENPFAAPGGAAFPTDAQISLAPDNKYQRLSLSATRDLTMTTRLSLTAEYGKMEQDEELLPYTVNTLIAPLRALPRDSAEAEIDVTHVSLNLTSRPTNKVSINARYRYYDTVNKTDRTLFMRVTNDTGSQSDIANGAFYTLPFDYSKNSLDVDAVYRITGATRIKAGLGHELTDRDYRSAEQTKENRYKLGLSSRLSSVLTAMVDYTRAEKRIDGGYDNESLYNAYHSYSSASGMYNYSATGNFDIHPDLRQLDLSERDRDSYSVKINLFPMDTTAVSLSYRYRNDDYNNSELGWQEDRLNSYTVDVTSSPSKNATFYAYYTNDLGEKELAGHSFTSAGPLGTKFTQAEDDTRRWWSDQNDKTDTIGIGTSLAFLRGQFTVDADYIHAKSTTEIELRVASALPSPVDMPDLETKRDTVNLTGRYKLRKDLVLGLGYGYEKYESDDWATDGLNPASGDVDNILLLTGSAPDYEAHLVKLFMTIKM